MKHFLYMLAGCSLLMAPLSAGSFGFIQEGAKVIKKEPTLKNITEKVLVPLLPYNPITVEVRQGEGAMTNILKELYPKGECIVIDGSWGLDALCQGRCIMKADLIRWDAKEVDPLFIKNSSFLIGTASVLSIKTYNNKKERNTKFMTLQRHLDCKGFCLLTHYYKEGGEGESVFVKKEIYDAIYR